MNLGPVGLHDRNQNLGVWRPILLLALAVAAWLTAAQQERQSQHHRWDSALEGTDSPQQRAAEYVVKLLDAVTEQVPPVSSSVLAASPRVLCLHCRLRAAVIHRPEG